jgi:CRISPR-associated exonuclease Cas4
MMGNNYNDDELLMLSGIQHIAFCERQWAMIHIEQQWQENVKTVEGRFVHEKVDDPEFFESRGDILISRSVPLISRTLGLYGIADMVEFHLSKDSKGIELEKRTGKWSPVPVEYKRGKPKTDSRDEVQLCAQGICLEEMLDVSIPSGYLYYAKTRKRLKVNFDKELREKVKDLALKMHALFDGGVTPKAVYKNHCKNCSLIERCIPKVTEKQKNIKKYIGNFMDLGGNED